MPAPSNQHNHNTTRPSTRPLGDQERYLHNLHLFGGLIGAIQLDIGGPLDFDLTRKALDWLQMRHPILRAHIEYSGFGRMPHFPWIYRKCHFQTKGTNSIPLTQMEISNETELNSLIQQEFAHPIKSAKAPRMRAILISDWLKSGSHKLILVTDHAGIDAQAVARAAKDLMEFLADPKSHEGEPFATDLPPSLESRLKAKPDTKSKPYQPAIRIPHKYSLFNRRQTLTLAHRLSQDQTMDLKRTIRENRTTLHGFLCASLLKSLGEKYDLQQMTCLSSVEFRRICTPPIPEETFGCYIDTIRTKHDVTKPIWKLARNVSFKLISTLAHNQASASILKFPDMAQLRAETWSMIRSGMRMDALAVTTAGEFDLGIRYDEFTLQDILLTMSLNQAGAAILLMSFEQNGALTLNMCFTTPDLSVAQAKELLDKTISDATS